LFKNYLIAKEKFKPDYFLYENNKSAAQSIKDQISKELGYPLQYINSALVSAQNRQRFYCHNIPDVPQPEDRGILLTDILESGTDLSQNEKCYCLTASYNGAVAWNTLERGQRTMVAEPVRIGTIENGLKNKDFDSKQYRVYSPDGKSTTLCSQGGGVDAKTGLYACPIGDNTNISPIYEVRNGLITIKDKEYPIKLTDGLYIIRKLTIKECRRLQTIPDWYIMPCSDTQNYKMLGNGWTKEVIKHLLSHIPNILNEEIIVLSMYDGMSCGQITLKDMRCNIKTYYATEIDKYCIQTTQENFPNTIQLGNAFQVRNDDWKLKY
jgi:DNA (cytosine-5)-methyltransferase 3A